MEKEISRSTGRELGRVLLMLVPIGITVLMYVWVLNFATSHTRGGNFALAVLTLLNLLAVFASIKAINLHFRHVVDPQHRKYWRIAAGATVVVALLHLIGGFMPTPEAQSDFLFAPLWCLGGLVAILVIRFIMKETEHRKEEYRKAFKQQQE